MKILFIENHSIFAGQVIVQFLFSHQVNIVPTLSDARANLAANTYDLILVDYDLDDGKGDEIVREIRKSGNRIKIIGVSAKEEGNAALIQAGVDAVCSKMEFNRIQEFI